MLLRDKGVCEVQGVLDVVWGLYGGIMMVSGDSWEGYEGPIDDYRAL